MGQNLTSYECYEFAEAEPVFPDVLQRQVRFPEWEVKSSGILSSCLHSPLEQAPSFPGHSGRQRNRAGDDILLSFSKFPAPVSRKRRPMAPEESPHGAFQALCPRNEEAKG